MRWRLFGKALVGAACAVLVFGGQAEVAAAPVPAAACNPQNPRAAGDLDGDGTSDAVVGMPLHNDQAGAVDVRYTARPSDVLTAGGIGAGTGAGDGFGTAIAVGDLDRDGCGDLVIGSPAEGQSDASDGAGGNEGQVHIVFGSRDGIDVGTRITLRHDSSTLDHFGAALAMSTRFDGEQRVHDLYVGAPDATVSGHTRAGEVFHFVIAPGGDRRVTATLSEVRDQDSAGVPGAAERDDRFGSVLASVDVKPTLVATGGVLVGAPQEDVGSVRDAGSVWFLRVNQAGAPIAAQSWSQDSPQVPGAAEAGDRFGAALGSRSNRAAIGVPGEDIGSAGDAGMVQVFHQSSTTGAFAPGASLTQDSAGIPGAVEAGDAFGTAVSVGFTLLCAEAVDLAVGAPGEDVGTRADAGSVTLTSLRPGVGCAPRTLAQGAGLADSAEPGDQVGLVLGLTRGNPDLEEDRADRLLLGVPWEDLGARSDAGMVQPTRGGIVANGVRSETLQFSRGHLAASRYGMVLSSPAG